MINVVDDGNSQTNRDIEIGGWSNIESALHQERRILFKKNVFRSKTISYSI
jgi:hypothetical protein